MHNPDNYPPKSWTIFSSASKLILFFCKDSALFILTTLLAYFKDPKLSWNRVPAPWVELHIACAPCIRLFYFLPNSGAFLVTRQLQRISQNSK